MERGERPYTLFHGWCDVSYTCYQYVAGLGLELAILGSAVRLTVDCAREPGLQKCGLFLRPLAKIRMHFLNVSHLMTKPIKCPLWPAKTQISPGTRPVWSEYSHFAVLSQWVAEDPVFLHADSEDSDQAGRMHRLICVFDGRNGHFVGFVMRRLMYTLQLSHLASRASQTADPGVAGSTPARPHIVCWNWSCAFFHW